MAILLACLISLFSLESFAEELSILSLNLETTFFKSKKNNIIQLNRVINYYGTDVNIFHQTYNKKADLLKTNMDYPYFTYNDDIKRRTGTILTSKVPITHEEFTSFEKNCSIWKVHGITNVSAKLENDKILQFFNVSMRKNKKHWWDDILKLEKVVKRAAYDDNKVITIEFGDRPHPEMLEYISNRLDLFDVVDEWIKRERVETNEFDTGFDQKTPTRTNIVFINKSLINNVIEVTPVFDGTHDENRYFKDAGILYKIDFD